MSAWFLNSELSTCFITYCSYACYFLTDRIANLTVSARSQDDIKLTKIKAFFLTRFFKDCHLLFICSSKHLPNLAVFSKAMTDDNRFCWSNQSFNSPST